MTWLYQYRVPGLMPGSQRLWKREAKWYLVANVSFSQPQSKYVADFITAVDQSHTVQWRWNVFKGDSGRVFGPEGHKQTKKNRRMKEQNWTKQIQRNTLPMATVQTSWRVMSCTCRTWFDRHGPFPRTLSPDIALCGWLGSKHQLSN